MMNMKHGNIIDPGQRGGKLEVFDRTFLWFRVHRNQHLPIRLGFIENCARSNLYWVREGAVLRVIRHRTSAITGLDW